MYRNGFKLTRVALRRREGLRLTVAIATLIGALSALSLIITPFFISNSALTGEKNLTTAELHQQAQEKAKARRTGSIIFVTHAKMCEELRFDNVAEQILSVDSIDCEDWLTRTTTNEAKSAKAANMRSVLDSFKK